MSNKLETFGANTKTANNLKKVIIINCGVK